MKAYVRVFIILLGFVLPVITGHCLAQTDNRHKSPHSAVDVQLGIATNPQAADVDIANAVNGVFHLTGLDSAGLVDPSVTQTIVASERAFRQHRQAASHEKDIVVAMNHLSDRLDLPEFGKTNLDEVRKLHVSMISIFPRYLLGDLKQRIAANPGHALMIRTELSPLETTLIFAMLLHQKLSNPDYQLTRAEYAKVWALKRNGLPIPKAEERSRPIHDALARSINTGVLPDTQVLLSDLGIVGGGK